MGILDDAIREHLALKRRQGAPDDELQRLEDEAFGPPTRPGEPDFPGEGEREAAGNGDALEVESAPEPADEPTRVVSAAELEEVEEAVPYGAEQPEAEPEQPEAEPEQPEAEPESPVDEPLRDEPQGPPEPAIEEAAPEDHETAPSDELELEDLELELDEEIASVRDLDESDREQAPVAPPEEPSGEAPSQPPIESLDTVEHEVEPSAEPEEGPAAQEEGGEEGEDVLEETPEFLRDAPEDDELWFEQGEPKDFDF